ncbi:hypothetical protein V502_09482 [Pseudogymnoascus sp. VKM F-4520 (FW-2644)]|nr:hypothetical protein V502_09482 [Pseudogymnoascus sp. VKM F-4520 (FW-2644)]
MGSVNSLSDTSSEVATLGISHSMKPASEWNLNAVGAMNQPTDPEVFRFLNLPRELRDKIYRNLLIHYKPVELKRSELYEIGKKCRYYETRLGLAPQICRTNKTVACESFAVLYGENTFHFTSDDNIRAPYCHLGLNMYSHLVKSIQVDTFRPEFKLSMQSQHWATYDAFTRFFGNLKKLRFNLPQELEILTENGRDSLLEAKRYVPKYATVEFYGASSDIAIQLMTAWSKHVPKEKEYPKRAPQPFNPLEWSKKQAREQERDECKQLLSPPVSVRHVRIAKLKRPSPDGCSGEELQVSKKQKLDGETLLYNLGPLGGSLEEQIGKGGLKINSEARLHASDEIGLAAEERTLASKEKSLAEEKFALEKKKLAIEKEGLALEKKKLALENERLALEKKKLGVEDEKIPPSPASSVSM